MIFRPTESSKNIVDFYRGYLLTTFTTNNEKYNDQLKKALEEEKAIADGPYISVTDPYEKGKSLITLSEEGVVSKEILKLQGFHPERTLYRHQEEAVRLADKNKNLIITTGTGSGKTESFLIPIVNYLLKEKESGTLSSGVRALIIYPMNALVNDQIMRLRELFSGNADCGITFGKYTGETEEKYKDAIKAYEANGDIPLDGCELISREQMRENPPNILITNYAMLEYMLLRPGDNVIFSKENSEKWKFIVFDEAHSYTGAKGIEVGTLIKRVKAMLDRKDIQFILTSATLGDENSNSEIINFGNSLCDAEFTPSSIIRSHTIKADATRKSARIDKKFYQEFAGLICDNVNENDMLSFIDSYGISHSGSDAPSAVFDIVLHDEFYSLFRNCLRSTIRSVSDVAERLNISENELADFITVASFAHKNGEKLFEAKYHMFLRGIEGVYVTLKPLEKLFIHKMETYLNPEDNHEYKVFNVSFCSNCNALFITAQNENGKLVQHSGFVDDYSPEIYLLSDDEYEGEDEQENIYYVCSRCGEIKHTIEQLSCGHGSGYAVKLRRVKGMNEQLHKCPCCHAFDTHRSIVRPYYLGSEAATAVIATSLYNELPSKQIEKGKTTIREGLFGKTEIKEPDKVTDLTKQFLTFSDNRQAAAFFASYLQYSYNATLVKCIMNEIVKEKGDRNLSEFIKILADKLGGEYKLDKTSDSHETDAWIYTLKELSNFKAKNSLTSLGMLVFDTKLELQELPQYSLNKDETETLFRILIRDIMHDAAVKVNITLSKSDWENISVSGFKRIYCKEPSSNKNVIGWLPEKGKSNRRIRLITRFLGLEYEDAYSLLGMIWEYLISAGMLTKEIITSGRNNIDGFVLDNSIITVKKPEQLYCCSECKKITPYNLKGMCENPACGGVLQVYDVENHCRSEHYRNLYNTLDIVSMNVKEHTAQLASKTAAEFQRDFKNKLVNVLSCSTTFEMGVDVGSLETVFMRNMPPTPANYAQRAGRAGRSFYSAAYALTYCGNNSHDLNYFKNPVDMISGTIYPPYFNMENDKIVLRHMSSSALSCFWKENESYYFKNIGDFIDNGGFEKFKEYLLSKPSKVREYLKRVVPENLYNHFGVDTFDWVKLLFSDNQDNSAICDIAITKYKDEVSILEKARNKALEDAKEGRTTNANALNRSINTIKAQTVIEFFSKNNIIPKYGFPVDTVELLKSAENSGEALRLNRDLFTAISEYAPDSQIVANGKLITSRYIRKLSGYEWPTYKYVKCEKCRTHNRVLDVDKFDKCQYCGNDLTKQNGAPSSYIIPKFGFVTEKDEKPVNTNKPERTYHGAVSYVGDDKRIESRNYLLNGQLMQVGNSRMDSLLVLNESSFYVCHSCGYTELLPKENKPYFENKNNHKNSSGYSCNNKILRRRALGHEFQTDVIMLKFPEYLDSSDPDVAWTILYSLLEGLSHCLNIDRKELSGCIQYYRDENSIGGNYAYVLFDNTPGGAGYVRQLENPQLIAKMIKAAYKVVNSCNCGSACYSCLCNYYNQKQHDILNRNYAKRFYEELLCGQADIHIERIDEEIAADYESEDVEKNAEEANRVRLDLCGKGRTITGNDVWEELLEDCDESEELLINHLRDAVGSEKICDCIYGEYFRLPELGKTEFFASAVWPEKNVMLFLEECVEDYCSAKKSNWKCYCTTEEFDVSEFINNIKK